MSDIAIKPDGRNLTFAGMLFHTRVAFISVGSNKEQGSPGCEKEADRMRAAEHGMAKASKTRLCVGGQAGSTDGRNQSWRRWGESESWGWRGRERNKTPWNHVRCGKVAPGNFRHLTLSRRDKKKEKKKEEKCAA